MLHLAWPWMLAALPLPWLVRRLLTAAPPSAGGVLFAPFADGLADAGADGPGARRGGRAWQALAWLIWLLMVAAACRPQWLGEPVELPETGRSLVLAVDVSGSMETADLADGQATRLDVVKRVAADFIRRREGDRVGLILFGTHAYLQSPLSFDRTTVAALLEDAVVGIAGRETAIGDAIGLVLKRLRVAPGGEAVLVLLTDGANTAGNVSPQKAAELAAREGLKIHTIGVGAQQMAVRGLLGTRLVNPAADLDEATLKAIAETTGGRYFRATDRGALDGIYRRLDELEPVAGGSRVVRPVDALYPWPLGAALLASLSMGWVRVFPGWVGVFSKSLA